MKRVVVIDDDPHIRRLLRLSLEIKEFEVFEAATGFEGIQVLQACRPDILLLDLNLGDTSGLEVLRQLRTWSALPVIVISVRDAERDIVELLDAGADDYVIKPFNSGELLARINSALRRLRPDPESRSFQAGSLSLDFDSRELRLEGKLVHLTPTEFAILGLMAKHAGKIVTTSTILREVWGPLADQEGGSLRVHILALRRKIEPDPTHPARLITEPGVGYRLRDT
jgi:two-component system KDP operon response regulator KdpE